MDFKNFLSEERTSNEYGFIATGQLIDLGVKMNPKNSLIEITVQGKKSLTSPKSVQRLKAEYDENDFKQIEQIWKKVSKEKSKIAEELIKEFENDLNSLIIDMEKEIDL